MPLAIAPIACSRTPKCMFRPPWRLRFEIARALEGQPGLGRRREIRRAADQGGYVVRDGVQHLAAGIARRDSRRVRREVRNVAVPAVGQPAFKQTIELLGELGMLGCDSGPESAPRPREAAPNDLARLARK